MIIPSKLKVVELRAELSARGLDTRGVKAALVERLQHALNEENGGEASVQSETLEGHASLNDSKGGDESENDTTISQAESKDDNPPVSKDDESSASEMFFSFAEQETKSTHEEKTDETSVHHSPVETDSVAETLDRQPEPEEESGSPDVSQQENDAQIDDTPTDLTTAGSGGGGDNSMEVDVKREQDGEEETEDPEQQNGVSDEPKAEIKEEGDIKQEQDESESKESRKRRRSRSPSPSSGSESPNKYAATAVKREAEPEIDDNKVTLSWYDSDLSLTIDSSTFYSAVPLSFGGFGYIWAGVRGTHGFTKGKLCYQAKILNFCEVGHLTDEANPNLLRVGWSTFNTSLQLGEEPLSYGYGGTGKFSVGCNFSDYGASFGLNDVVTAYLEFTEENVIMSFSINDEPQGTAITVPVSELEGQALAPHVLTKNAEFAVNFGQLDEPWGQIEEGYTFLTHVPVEETVPGPRRPEKRSDCEILMMCGLPGCGKTTWANKHAEENPEKRFTILGTNSLIDKMKVNGLPRKANYSGRWDVLIEKCTKCLTRLMENASRRRRNYILDQTNVYPSAQRRKMRVFDGFIKKAVVIVPTDEEFKSRVEKQAMEEQKDVPDSAVMEMKANFSLPDKEVFDEVIFVELQEEEAQALLEKYSKEAAAAGYRKKLGGMGGFGGGGGRGGGPPFKKFRGGVSGGGGGGFHHGGPPRHDGFRRGPPPSQGGPGGGFRRGGPSNRGGGWARDGQDRWRDNRNQGGFRHGGNDRSGWRGPPMGNGGRGPRDFDRGPGGGRPGGGGGYDRNARTGGGGPRSGGGSGGYNRDRNQHRGPPNDRKPRVDHKYGGGTGSTGGSITNSGNQWGQYGQSAGNAASNQGWGQGQTNQGWGAQTQQSWNYQQPQQQQQQQWKAGGYGQQQSSYGQGYSQQNYGGWQNYQGYQQNYSQQGSGSWSGQNSDGTYSSYSQNWPAWGYSTQGGSAGSQAANPSAHASQTK